MKAEILNDLVTRNDSKIVFLIMDGLGGLPLSGRTGTELETADTPNLDKFTAEGVCGLLDPVSPGITPGSGPAHLALFGYDPLEFVIGRGVLSALGVDFDLSHQDVAARLNFCTIDEQGMVTDRRAGRIPTETNRKLCEKIRSKVKLPEGVEFFIETESEHRAALILRGKGLNGRINDTDPQQTGVPPLEPRGKDDESERTAGYVREFLRQVREILKDDHPANMVLTRGFDRFESLPTFEERYGLRACAIAQYPMYRGLARLVGMEVLPRPETHDAMWDQLESNYNKCDFFFIHFKKADSYGEDGNFDAKVKVIEGVDRWAAALRRLNPDVLVVTGDHSTPALLKSHSWHPVPVLLWSRYTRPDAVRKFGEASCVNGGLGRMLSKNIMMISLASALRFKKFGA